MNDGKSLSTLDAVGAAKGELIQSQERGRCGSKAGGLGLRIAWAGEIPEASSILIESSLCFLETEADYKLLFFFSLPDPGPGGRGNFPVLPVGQPFSPKRSEAGKPVSGRAQARNSAHVFRASYVAFCVLSCGVCATVAPISQKGKRRPRELKEKARNHRQWGAQLGAEPWKLAPFVPRAVLTSAMEVPCLPLSLVNRLTLLPWTPETQQSDTPGAAAPGSRGL